MKKTETIHFRVSPEDKRKIKLAAEQQGKTVSEFVLEAVLSYIDGLSVSFTSFEIELIKRKARAEKISESELVTKAVRAYLLGELK